MYFWKTLLHKYINETFPSVCLYSGTTTGCYRPWRGPLRWLLSVRVRRLEQEVHHPGRQAQLQHVRETTRRTTGQIEKWVPRFMIFFLPFNLNGGYLTVWYSFGTSATSSNVSRHSVGGAKKNGIYVTVFVDFFHDVFLKDHSTPKRIRYWQDYWVRNNLGHDNQPILDNFISKTFLRFHSHWPFSYSDHR